jgi:hypothetical protein
MIAICLFLGPITSSEFKYIKACSPSGIEFKTRGPPAKNPGVREVGSGRANRLWPGNKV